MIRKIVRSIQLTLLFVVALFGYSFFADPDFDQWKLEFSQYAEQQGIKAEVLHLAFAGLLPDRKVLRLDAHQPEFSRPIWDYLDSAASTARVAKGRRLLAEYGELLERIHQAYHIPPEYILAIWGVETDYGNFMGGYSTIRSLATLAYQGRVVRREFWREQLVAALRIVQNNDMGINSLIGSWAGAFGHTQFIPTTFERYAVDFDGNGKRDLVNSIPDALASTANYLAQSGWIDGEHWAQEVKLPSTFEWSRADPTYWLPVRLWVDQELVSSASNQPLPLDNQGFIFLPAGYRGPSLLAYHNFNVLLKYNNAYSYVMAVGTLADQIRGEPALQATWPRDMRELSFAEKAELQELLTIAGYSTDGIDGRLGPNSRAALRRWQMDVGYPADGFAIYEHLEKLRLQVPMV
ncbi:lytic murein transglycosylase [Thiofilum flexile]|uniref:lytic murein transglycosylase n=1 Tax=Thiofilum flexile TaxID=125627 RepID=UPI0003773B79|nr:lytic murein transglycosylase [Thiofilum flexile]